jgi:hypothetical protein
VAPVFTLPGSDKACLFLRRRSAILDDSQRICIKIEAIFCLVCPECTKNGADHVDISQLVRRLVFGKSILMVTHSQSKSHSRFTASVTGYQISGALCHG